MNAAAVLARVHAAGGVAVVIDGRLKLGAAQPLPDALIADVRAHKAETLALLAANNLPPAEPSSSCPVCACGLFWRPSVLSGRPRPVALFDLQLSVSRRVAGGIRCSPWAVACVTART